MEQVYTVGHGTLGAEEFTELLSGAGVSTLVDVRRHPGSRRYPHFGESAMTQWLAATGIEYRHIESLGGRRKGVTDSPNTAWRNQQFAAYADHMASAEFASGVEELLAIAQRAPSAVMCTESLWWRCHRRMVADHLVLVAGADVEHLFHDGRTTPHDPMAEAVVVDDHVEYPASSTQIRLPID